MAKSEQQRQKKLAKKLSKERVNKKLMAQRQQQMSSLSGQMTVASAGAIEHCYITSSCHDGMGMGSVLIVRRVGTQHAFALFLVDVYCLGVKDAMGRFYSTAQLGETLADLSSRQPFDAVSPGVARGFVEAAVEYAQSLGLPPHADYRKVTPIWGNTVAEPVPEKYQFGKDGRPCYVNGPYDDIARQRQIVETLRMRVGEGNFDVFLGGPTSIELLDLVRQAVDDEDDLDDENTIEGSVSQRLVGRK